LRVKGLPQDILSKGPAASSLRRTAGRGSTTPPRMSGK